MTKIITWDLGATKCTAGLVTYDHDAKNLTCQKHYTVKLADTLTLEDLIEKLESGLDFSFPNADAICIGAAGYYDGKYLLHTNAYPYPMHFANTAELQEWPRHAIIHDYASIICATFTSYMDQPQNLKRLNSSPMKPHSRRVALGIGTGLGLKDGIQFPNGDFWLGQNEIGHIGIPTPPIAEKHYLDRHKEIMHFLQEKSAAESNKPITFEKILTGKGTTNLYEFFYPEREKTTPEILGQKIRHGEFTEMLDTFAWYMGLLIGTVQLIFMPEGGVWVTGGVVLNHLNIFDSADLFSGIYASPAYLLQREEYPLGVLCNHQHALIGNGYYAVKRLLET